MRTYQKIAQESKKLSLDQQRRVLQIIEEMAQSPDDSKEFDLEIVPKNREHLPKCVVCSSLFVEKTGLRAGRQRFHCISCGKYFTETTNTIMKNSQASKGDWKRVIIDTIEGTSIDKTARSLNLHHETVFNMRHKVMLGIVKFLSKDPVVLSEVAELDETYVPESFKGTKFQDDAPRKPRLHGEKAEKKGLSSEQICICAGVQRNHGAAFASTVNRSVPTSEEIKSVFSGHIGAGSIVFTDGAKGYGILEDDMDCAVERINTESEASRKVANLNNVNSFHAFIKERYGKYRGVATKYLNRYNIVFSASFRNRDEMITRLCDALLTPGPVDYSSSCKDVEEKNLLKI